MIQSIDLAADAHEAAGRTGAVINACKLLLWVSGRNLTRRLRAERDAARDAQPVASGTADPTTPDLSSGAEAPAGPSISEGYAAAMSAAAVEPHAIAT